MVRPKRLFSKKQRATPKISNSSQGNLGQVFHMVSRSLCCVWRHNMKLSIRLPSPSAFTDFMARGWARVSLQFVRGGQITTSTPPDHKHTFITPLTQALSVAMCFALSWWSLCTQLLLLFTFSHIQPHNFWVSALCLCSSFSWKEMGAFPHGVLELQIFGFHCLALNRSRAGNTYLWHTEPQRMTLP